MSATVGERIREAREAMGWSRADLARRMEWPDRKVRALESGSVQDPDRLVFAIAAVARATGLPLGFFRATVTTAAWLAGAPGDPPRPDPPKSTAPIFWCRNPDPTGPRPPRPRRG